MSFDDNSCFNTNHPELETGWVFFSNYGTELEMLEDATNPEGFLYKHEWKQGEQAFDRFGNAILGIPVFVKAPNF